MQFITKKSVFVQGYKPKLEEREALIKLNVLMSSPPSVFDDPEVLNNYYNQCIDLENQLGENIEIAKFTLGL